MVAPSHLRKNCPRRPCPNKNPHGYFSASPPFPVKKNNGLKPQWFQGGSFLELNQRLSGPDTGLINLGTGQLQFAKSAAVIATGKIILLS
jgi:hypothetical protein